MKPTNPVQSMEVYASDSSYRKQPTRAQQLAGMVPLDTLPADWWNWLWEQVTTQINNTVGGLGSVYDEILSVLTDANIQASELQVNQLLNAIKTITQRYGTAGTAGAVKSSSDSGKVAIDANGYMSPNGMGIPTSLNTTAKSIVSAINELLAALNAYKTSNDGAVAALGNDKAPNNHASTENTYGVADTTKYGHVKLSSTYTEDEEGTGVAATQSGLAASYDALKTMIEMVGGLPTHVQSDPVVNISGNGTEAVDGTVSITTSGFYYIELAGGDGEVGGYGGTGGTGGTGHSSASGGGAGGAGERILIGEGGIGVGGFPRQGALVKGIFFLPAGDYNYRAGGKGRKGSDGGAGGNGGTPYSGGGAGGGGAGGVTGADGYNCKLSTPFATLIPRGANGSSGGIESTGSGSNVFGGAGAGGGGAGGFGGFGGTTEFWGDNIYLRALGGPGGYGMAGGGGGGGSGSRMTGSPGGPGGSGGSNVRFDKMSLVGFDWTVASGTKYNAGAGGSGAGGSSSSSGGAGGSGGYNWDNAFNNYYKADIDTTTQRISRYMLEYLAEPGYKPVYLDASFVPNYTDGYLKIYPLE